MSKDIRDLFEDELHDILSSEEQIVKALPKLIAAADNADLKKAITHHLQETKGQIKRLNQVFKVTKIKRQTKFCKATKGLLEECNEVLEDYKTKSLLRDLAIISKAQRVEHYEISAYGTVKAFAKELGYTEAAKLLQANLDEEANADKALTKISEGGFLSSGILHKEHLIEEKAQEAKSPAKKGAKGKKSSSTVAAVKKAAKAAPGKVKKAVKAAPGQVKKAIKATPKKVKNAAASVVSTAKSVAKKVTGKKKPAVKKKAVKKASKK